MPYVGRTQIIRSRPFSTYVIGESLRFLKNKPFTMDAQATNILSLEITQPLFSLANESSFIKDEGDKMFRPN
jgi:hypothetical protein